jgi:hypothetical protein
MKIFEILLILPSSSLVLQYLWGSDSTTYEYISNDITRSNQLNLLLKLNANLPKK